MPEMLGKCGKNKVERNDEKRQEMVEALELYEYMTLMSFWYCWKLYILSTMVEPSNGVCIRNQTWPELS